MDINEFDLPLAIKDNNLANKLFTTVNNIKIKYPKLYNKTLNGNFA